ncbi:MAG TPA: translational repressor RegA, partial [Leptospiraceae bacterium]|nr:translational repressor RegA [Leptospiraceae bacterium]
SEHIMNDLFNNLGIPIELNTPEDFLKIKETLTRIGISSRKEKKLFTKFIKLIFTLKQFETN